VYIYIYIYLYRVLAGKPEEKKLLGIPWCSLEDNIKRNRKQI